MISDALPTAKTLQCDFAKYNTKYWYNEGEQNVYRISNLTLVKYKIPAACYTQMKTSLMKWQKMNCKELW